MSRFCRLALPAVIGLVLLMFLGFGAACKKQAATPADPAQAYPHLAEAANVLAALNQKNYDEVVSSLAKMKEILSTEEQQNEYGLLTRQVKNKLLDASETDEKAAEALRAFRVMTVGR